MMRQVVAAAVWAALTLTATWAAAQTSPNLESGTHNFGSYHGGDIDTVNLVHGGVDFHIPLVSFPQRGQAGPVQHYFRDSAKKWGVQQMAARAGTGFNIVYPWIGGGVSDINAGVWIQNSLDVVVGRTRTLTSSSNEGTSVLSESDTNYWVGLPDGSVHNLDGIEPAIGPNSVFVSVDTSGFSSR